MKTIITILLSLWLAHAGAQPYIGWYKVGLSNNSVWAQGNKFSIKAIQGKDSLWFSNFSNQGAQVYCTVEGDSLIVPKQTVTIDPYGGSGQAKPWKLTVSARGAFSENANGRFIDMLFFVKQEGYPPTKGTLRAKKVETP